MIYGVGEYVFLYKCCINALSGAMELKPQEKEEMELLETWIAAFQCSHHCAGWSLE